MNIARQLFTTFLVLALSSATQACPYCSAEMQTLSEELADADVAVIAKLVKPTAEVGDEASTTGPIDPETGAAEFEIVKIIKGPERLAGVETFEAIYFGAVDYDKQFLVRGIAQSEAGSAMDWAIPLAMSPLAVEYVEQLRSLPDSGADRLAFFQDYLEHEDRQLAQDAYDEFARSSYADLKALEPRMDRERVLAMINDPLISPNRRRLFFTMLGVCGGAEDIPMLEAMLKSDARVLVPAAEATAAVSIAAGGPLSAALAPDFVRRDERKQKAGLDALIGCYLTLKGGDGLDLIDERFLSDPEADQTHVYSALMSLRISAEEGGVVSQDRLLQSARLLLKNPLFADQVIPDLARWEDWSVLEELGQMFREAEEGTPSSYVREPVITYLDVAAEQPGEVGQQAEALLADLEPLDPETFRRARSLRDFGYLRRARTVKPKEMPEETPAESDLASAEASDEADNSDSDAMPDPATFGAEATAEAEGMSRAEPAASQLSGATAGEPELEPELPPTDAPAESRAAAKPVIPAGAEPLTPPSTIILLAMPLAAAAACFGLFWLILRGGGA